MGEEWSHKSRIKLDWGWAFVFVLTKSLEGRAILNGVFVLPLRGSWSSGPMELQNLLRFLKWKLTFCFCQTLSSWDAFFFLDTVGPGKNSFCCCRLLGHCFLSHFSSLLFFIFVIFLLPLDVVIFILCVWAFCHQVCLCTTFVLLPTEAKRKYYLGQVTGACQTLCRCWESNPIPLLTVEPAS